VAPPLFCYGTDICSRRRVLEFLILQTALGQIRQERNTAERSKRSFADSGKILFDTKETVIELNGVHIEAYPSHHLDSMRGLKDVSFIYLDEADFFPPGQSKTLVMFQRDTLPNQTLGL
jgi:hypothetical protein